MKNIGLFDNPRRIFLLGRMKDLGLFDDPRRIFLSFPFLLTLPYPYMLSAEPECCPKQTYIAKYSRGCLKPFILSPTYIVAIHRANIVIGK